MPRLWKRDIYEGERLHSLWIAYGLCRALSSSVPYWRSAYYGDSSVFICCGLAGLERAPKSFQAAVGAGAVVEVLLL